MQFTALAVDLVTLTLLILRFGLRILVRGCWLLAWLRGTFGLALMAPVAGLNGCQPACKPGH